MPALDKFYYPDPQQEPLFRLEPFFHEDEAGESLAATLAAMFAARGDDFAVGLLANSKHKVERWTFNSGPKEGQFSRYKWLMTVPPPLYVLYADQDQSGENLFWENRQDFLSQLFALGGPLLEDLSSDDVVITAALQTDPQWRETARGYLTGEGVNNQGNVNVNTRPKVFHDELWFRHIEEQYIYEALLRHGYPFMPLPVVMRANGKRRRNGVHSRIEPDFCILYKGRLIVLEIDGGSHWETPADAEKRLLFLREHGAVVRRISADACGNPGEAALAVADVLKSLDAELSKRA